MACSFSVGARRLGCSLGSPPFFAWLTLWSLRVLCGAVCARVCACVRASSCVSNADVSIIYTYIHLLHVYVAYAVIH